jgi:predicted nucleic acid-binding protein
MFFLLQQAGDILIPPAVNLELERQITGWNSLDWLSIHQLENEHAKNAQSWVCTGQLDPGEAEADWHC